MPAWLELLLRVCPCLFCPSARADYARAYAFGTSRAAVWCRKAGVAGLRAALVSERQVLQPAQEAVLSVGIVDESAARVLHLVEEIDQTLETWDDGVKLHSALAKVRRAEQTPTLALAQPEPQP